MEMLQVILIMLGILFLGLIFLYLALKFTERLTKKKVVVHVIFRGFGQKMWMTVGLGLIFFSLYLLMAVFISYFDDPQHRLNFFFLVYEHPILFIYLGLFTFALTSTGIYAVRVVIKHLYNTRKK